MKHKSFEIPPSAAIAEGATTPDPGGPGARVWSTTAGKTLEWDGNSWEAPVGSGGGGGGGIELALAGLGGF